MDCTIKGTFKNIRVYQGKKEFFHTLEEYGTKYPTRIQVAHVEELFRDVGENEVFEMILECSMREFVKADSRNIVFYANSVEYQVFSVKLTAKKGGE